MLAKLPRISIACLFTLGCAFVVSEEAPGEPIVVLSSGAEGGGYWQAATRLQKVAARQSGLAVEVLPSSGSLENMEKLLDKDSAVNLVFAQADAAKYYLDSHPGQTENLDLLENIGQECVFIVTGRNSSVRTDKDLQKAKNLRLAIGSDTSGVAVTFNYLVGEVPEMADISVSYEDTLSALQQLNTPDATVDAVMLVHRPRAHSPEVDYAVANVADYNFVELSDKRFTEDEWNGNKIYRSMNLAMPGDVEPVRTLCVKGLLLGNKHKLTLDQRNTLGDLVGTYWMEVYPTE